MKTLMVLFFLLVTTTCFSQTHACKFIIHPSDINGSAMISAVCDTPCTLKFTVYNYQGLKISSFLYPMNNGKELLQLNLKYFVPGFYSIVIEDGSSISKFNIDKK